jgi:hypothetical protein
MSGKTLSNPLGDIRAESDHGMLHRAFYETPDYLVGPAKSNFTLSSNSA